MYTQFPTELITELAYFVLLTTKSTEPKKIHETERCNITLSQLQEILSAGSLLRIKNGGQNKHIDTSLHYR